MFTKIICQMLLLIIIQQNVVVQNVWFVTLYKLTKVFILLNHLNSLLCYKKLKLSRNIVVVIFKHINSDNKSQEKYLIRIKRFLNTLKFLTFLDK